MVSNAQMGTGTKLALLMCNVIVAAAALHTVDVALDSQAGDDGDDIMSQPNPGGGHPTEAMLPNLTVTKEMKVRMFFNQLEVDHSLVDPDLILQSIRPWEPHIQKYSARYDVDPDLVRAIIFAESKGDPFSVSRDGAVGLMQLMPVTAEAMGAENALDPEQNIKAGVSYIAWIARNFGEEHVLWAWNAGPTRMREFNMPFETRRFIVKVMSVRSFLKSSGEAI